MKASKLVMSGLLLAGVLNAPAEGQVRSVSPGAAPPSVAVKSGALAGDNPIPVATTQQSAFDPDGSIANSGAFTYSYPFRLPEGTHGVSPSMSLVYNSFAPDGILGMGFSLSGFSKIERDSMFPIGFNSNDHFTLDGEKLVYVSSEYAFHPQNESFDRIEAFSTSGAAASGDPNSTQSYWVVTKSDGTKLYFGATDDSRIDAVGKNGLPRVWALSKVEDVEKNYYTIEYTEETGSGAYYPKQIVYTKNDLTSPLKFKTVLFTYQTRPDIALVYRPTQIQTTLRLQEISVFVGTNAQGAGGSLLRKYGFAYQPSVSSKRSLLASVTEYGSDGISALPGVQFGWPTTASTIAWDVVDNQANTNGDRTDLTVGDFDGDGRDDYLRQEKGEQASDQSLTLQIRLATSNAYEVLQSRTSANAPYTAVGDLNRNRVEWAKLIPGDFNGDGMTDFIRQERAYGVDDDVDTVGVYLAQGGGKFQYKLLEPNRAWRAEWVNLIPGDFNGDGITDLIRQENDYLAGDYNNVLSWYKFDANADMTRTLISDNYTEVGDKVRIIPGDFNGDGKTDYLRQRAQYGFANDSSNPVVVWLSDDFGGFSAQPQSELFANENLNNIYSIFMTGDFNGDGLTDLLRQQISSDTVYLSGQQPNPPTVCMYLALGGGKFAPPTAIAGGNYQTMSLIPGDFNGDGRTDVLHQAQGGTSTNPTLVYLTVSYSQGGATQSAEEILSAMPRNYNRYVANILTGDFNGDGIMEYIRQEKGVDSTDNIDTVTRNTRTTVLDLLSTVTLPTGGVIAVEYTAAPQLTGAVVPSPHDSSKSIVPNKSPRALATKITYTDGQAGNPPVVTKYEYTDGLRLAGFRSDQTDLGFKTVVRKQGEGLALTSLVTAFHQTPPLQARVSSTTVFGPSSSVAYRQTVFAYQIVLKTNYPQVNFVAVKSRVINDFDGISASSALSSKETYEYDDFGRLVQKNNLGLIGAGEAPLDEYAKVTEEWSFVRNATTNLSKPVSQKSLSYTKDHQWGLAAEVDYYYDGNSPSSPLETQLLSKGRLTATSTWSSDTERLVTKMDHDSWGNLIKIWDARFNAGELAGMTKPTTEITFDPDYHAQVTSHISRKSDTVAYTAKTKFDLLLNPYESLDINSQVTSRTFDVFGRVLKTFVAPDVNEATTTTEYSDVTAPTTFPRFTLTKRKGSSNESLNTYSYFDGLGRTVQTSQGVGARWTIQAWRYNAKGQNDSLIVPYTSPSSDFDGIAAFPKTQTVFDPMGRALVTTNPDGTQRKTFYRYDVTAQVDENGHLTSVQNQPGVVTSNHYEGDAFSSTLTSPLQADLTTPSSTITTKSFRGLIETSDPLNNVTIETFDMAGRRLSLDTPDLEPGKFWDYKYDANGNLKTQTDPNGKVITFVYDALNRLTDKTYSDTTPAVHYTYDLGPFFGLGRLWSVSFARGRDDYTYDARGRVAKLTRMLDGKSRSMSFTYDSMDRPVEQKLPTGEKLIHSYGTDGNLTSITGKTGYVSALAYSALNKVTSMHYGNGLDTVYDYYDTVGDTDWQGSGKALSFRLKSIQAGPSASVMNTTYSYDQADNIKRKTDVNGSLTQTYGYDSRDRLDWAESTSFGSVGSVIHLDFQPNSIDNLELKDSVNISYTPGRPHAVSSASGVTFGYDDNGNLTSRTSGENYLYDAENRLTDIERNGRTVASFSYDANRQRTTKRVGTKTTYYWFDGYEEDFDTSAEAPQAPSADIPDSLAGRVYLQDAWTTSDGWVTTTGTKAVGSGNLTFTRNPGATGFLDRTFSTPVDADRFKVIKLRARAVSGTNSMRFKQFAPLNVTVGVACALTTEWKVFTIDASDPAKWSGDITRIGLVLDADGPVEIDWLYIGDGTSLPSASATEYPGNPVGTKYLQDAWATVDSWTGIVSVPGGGVLRLTKTAIQQTADRLFTTGSLDQKQLILKARRISGTENLKLDFKTSTNTILSSNTFELTSEWKTFTATAPVNTGKLTLSLFYGNANPTTCEIDWIYIGNGSQLPPFPENLGSNPGGAAYLHYGWQDLDGWKANGWLTGSLGGQSVIEPRDGFLHVTTTDIDPWVNKDDLAFSGAANPIVSLRMRQTAGTPGRTFQLYYGTQNHYYDGAYSYTGTIPNTALNQWVIITLDMSNLTFGGTDWITSTIKALRFDLGTSAGQAYDIDWIYVGNGNSTPASVGTYAQDTWTNTDGWAPQDSGPALAVSDGTLKVGTSGSLGRYMPISGKTVTMRVRTRDNTTRDAYWTAWHVQSMTNTPSSHFTLTGAWSVVSASFTSVVPNQNLLQIYQNNLEIDWITIADESSQAPITYPVSPEARIDYYKTSFSNTSDWTGFEYPNQVPGMVAVVGGDLVATITPLGGLRLLKNIPAQTLVMARIKSNVTTALNVGNDTSSLGVNLTAGVWKVVQFKMTTAGAGVDFDNPSVNATLTIDSVYVGDGLRESGMEDYRSSILANGQRIAQISAQGLTYYHQDHLGSVIATTDVGGNKTTLAVYKPYGNKVDNGSDTDGRLFTDQLWDAESDLYYYNARYYDPELGRFTQPDPALWDGQLYGNASLTLEETVNPYLYAMNNPVKYTDPTGLVINTKPDVTKDDLSDQNLEVVEEQLSTPVVLAPSDDSNNNSDSDEAIPVGRRTKNGVPTASDPFMDGLSAGRGQGSGAGGSYFPMKPPLPGVKPGIPKKADGDYRSKTAGANANDRKQVDAVAKEFQIDRREFGDFVEQTKGSMGRGPSANFTYKQLQELAKEFVETYK